MSASPDAAPAAGGDGAEASTTPEGRRKSQLRWQLLKSKATAQATAAEAAAHAGPGKSGGTPPTYSMADIAQLALFHEQLKAASPKPTSPGDNAPPTPASPEPTGTADSRDSPVARDTPVSLAGADGADVDVDLAADASAVVPDVDAADDESHEVDAPVDAADDGGDNDGAADAAGPVAEMPAEADADDAADSGDAADYDGAAAGAAPADTAAADNGDGGSEGSADSAESGKPMETAAASADWDGKSTRAGTLRTRGLAAMLALALIVLPLCLVGFTLRSMWPCSVCDGMRSHDALEQSVAAWLGCDAATAVAGCAVPADEVAAAWYYVAGEVALALVAARIWWVLPSRVVAGAVQCSCGVCHSTHVRLSSSGSTAGAGAGAGARVSSSRGAGAGSSHSLARSSPHAHTSQRPRADASRATATAGSANAGSGRALASSSRRRHRNMGAAGGAATSGGRRPENWNESRGAGAQGQLMSELNVDDADAVGTGGDVVTMVVFGSGGHTGEMIGICRGLTARYSPRVYVRAASDTTSEPAALQHEHVASGPGGGLAFATIPRSREVGQSLLTTPFTMLKATLASVVLVARVQPDVLVVNGPGVCLPVVLAAFTVRLLVPHLLWMLVVRPLWLLCCCGSRASGDDRPRAARGQLRIVFVESVCRVQSVSATGKLVYLLVDRFLVQWPELHERWALSEYCGIVL